MNVKWVLGVCIAGLICSGCCSWGPGLSKDPGKSRRAMQRYVPAGMSMEDAVRKMEQAGFACQLVREQFAGTRYDCIRCEKLEQGKMQTRWDVYIMIDSRQTVQDWKVISRLITQ